MAKRKAKKTVRRRSYRRVGAAKAGVDLTGIALAVGGAVAARVLASKMSTSSNPTFQKFGVYLPLVAGVVLPMVSNSPMIKGLAVGMVAAGGVEALGQNGVKLISGMPVIANVYQPRQLPYKAVAGLPGNEIQQSGGSMQTIAGIL